MVELCLERLLLILTVSKVEEGRGPAVTGLVICLTEK